MKRPQCNAIQMISGYKYTYAQDRKMAWSRSQSRDLPEPPIFEYDVTKQLKVGSIYWGEIAQGPIQILPIGDTTWTLTCINIYSIQKVIIDREAGR